MFRNLRKKASVLSLGGDQPAPDAAAAGALPKVLAQVRDFEVALQAMDFLLDDRLGAGVALLNAELAKRAPGAPSAAGTDPQPAAILPLALGVMQFIEATLGFEADVMNKAHATLSDAETAAAANQRYNIKHRLVTSHIYPPGTEFQVTHAELTLLNALVMLLRENNGMVESAKALFKLRKAYHELDAIYRKIRELEPAFRRNLARVARNADPRLTSTVDLPGFEPSAAVRALLAAPPQPAELEDVVLMRNLEAVYQMRRKRIEGTKIRGSEANVNLFASAESVADRADLATPRGRASPLAATHATGNAQFLRAGNAANAANGDDSSDESFALASGADAPDAAAAVDGADSGPEFDQHSRTIFGAATPGAGSGTGSGAGSGAASTHSAATDTSAASAAASNHLHVSTIDEFIHSGVQLCFGILQVVLLLIPPAIGKVLSIVGFRGDRDTGLKMLWRTAITLRNIHGELALLTLLVFYDGPVQFVDVGYQLPGHHDLRVASVIAIDNKTAVLDGELEAIMQNPALYTPQLTARARRHFPNNALWLLQELRILALRGELAHAVGLMQQFETDKIEMQQIKALLVFDRAMLYAFKHDFEEAARDFVALVELNSWSKGLYLFLAGCCYLEKGRWAERAAEASAGLAGEAARSGADADASGAFRLAAKYLRLAPSYVPGHPSNNQTKTGGIGGSKKQMPFDKFLLRKLAQIEARQKEHPNLSFLECIGTLPIHELVYFWNGYNRMTARELNLLLAALAHTGAPGTPYAAARAPRLPELPDEAMIRYFITSIVLRLSGRVADGLQVLDRHVIAHYVDRGEPFKFTRLTYSPYLYPTALYERSMFVWLLKLQQPHFDAAATAHECREWLRKAEIVGDIGDYELSNRTGMRIKAAADRVEQLGK